MQDPSQQDPSPDLSSIQNPNQPEDAVLSDLESLCASCNDLHKSLEETSRERDELRIKIRELEKERFDLESQIDEILDSVRSSKEVLRRISHRIGEEKSEEESNVDDWLESIHKTSLDLETKFLEYEEMRKKEKKELENSIVSLTEENRDINSLLRVALVEKEAVEKSLSRMKGGGEHKRVAILQIAERGLQKVGFGFMMGGKDGEVHSDHPINSSVSTKSDGSECEEEVISLASTVEKIMKNLRLQIGDLKRSLDESRSDSERLQILVDKQIEKIAENTLCIKELEERENMLVKNVDELTVELTEAGEEVARWREACELEVEAGKAVIEEREKEVAMLQKELERTKSALDAANSKLALKERLAATAMAAQAAAEVSLQLADRRSAELRERIEELTRQVEEEADRSRKERNRINRRRVRHICWPWRALKLTPPSRAGDGGGASWVGNRTRRMMPEMEALLHFI